MIFDSIQGANQILSKLRDSVKKEDWKPVLDKLLIQEPFQVSLIFTALDIVKLSFYSFHPTTAVPLHRLKFQIC